MWVYRFLLKFVLIKIGGLCDDGSIEYLSWVFGFGKEYLSWVEDLDYFIRYKKGVLRYYIVKYLYYVDFKLRKL